MRLELASSAPHEKVEFGAMRLLSESAADGRATCLINVEEQQGRQIASQTTRAARE